MAAATTEPPRKRRPARPDRPSLILFSLAGFMAVLAALAVQVHPAAGSHSGRALLVRRIYTTTVVETVAAGRVPSRTVTVTAGAPPAPPTAAPAVPAPTTRSSATAPLP